MNPKRINLQRIKKIGLVIFIVLLCSVSKPLSSKAVTQDPKLFYDTYCTDNDYAIKWVTDAYYFCTRGKTASSTATKYHTLGFTIVAPDGTKADASIGGKCVKAFGDGVVESSDGYTYNLYKIEYTDMINYMALSQGDSLVDKDHYNSYTRNNNSPEFKFNAIMTITVDGKDKSNIVQQSNGTCTYSNSSYIYKSYSAIIGSANWSAATQEALKWYFNIPANDANISVKTNKLVMSTGISLSNGIYYNSSESMYYARYKAPFTLKTVSKASYNSDSFQANMNWIVILNKSKLWLGEYFFMLPQGANKAVSNSYNEENLNSDAGITDDRVSLKSWTTTRINYDTLITSFQIQPTTKNDLLTFQPKARIYNGASYESTTKRNHSEYVLAEYPRHDSDGISVTVDGTAPTASFSPNSSTWTNESITVTSKIADEYNGETQAGVYNAVRAIGTSSNGGSTFTYGSDSTYTGTSISTKLSSTGIYKISIDMTDNVGNTSTITSGTYKIDMLDPTIKATPASMDWTNDPVVVNLDATDTGGSGISTIYYMWDTQKDNAPDSGYTAVSDVDSTAIKRTTQGQWYLWYWTKDNAGNSSAKKVSGLYKIDVTKPIVTATPTSMDWTNDMVSVDLEALDNGGSGVRNIYYKWDTQNDIAPESGFVTLSNKSSTTITRHTQGKWYLWYWTDDKAINEDGESNTSTKKVTELFKIDTTKPTITATPTSMDWTNDMVSVYLEALDTGGSGVRNIYYKWDTQKDIAPEDGYVTVINKSSTTITRHTQGQWYLWYWTDDNAINEDRESNISTKRVTGLYKIDTTKPTITATPTSTDWTNDMVSVDLEAFDTGGSGVRNIYYKWDTQKDIAPENGYVTVSNKSSITITRYTQGQWYLWYWADDKAINEDGESNTSTKRVTGLFKIDTTKPTITATPTSMDWTNDMISVYLEAADTGGSGVRNIYYKWDTQKDIAPEDGFVTLSNKSSATITRYTQGQWYLWYWTDDKAINDDGKSNTSTKRVTGLYKIDTTKPTIVATPTSIDWTNDMVSVDLKALDTGGSGVRNIYYKWDTQKDIAPESGYVTVSNVSNTTITRHTQGQWYLWYWTDDNAINEDGESNTSTKKVTGLFKIDTTKPTITANPISKEWTNDTVSIDLAALDTGGSGVRNIYYKWDTQKDIAPESGYTTVSNTANTTVTQSKEGQWYLWYWTDDKALKDDNLSNISAKKVSGLYKIDKTPPSINATPTSVSWTKTSISVILKAEDIGGSGLRNIYYKWDTQKTIAPSSGYTSVSCKSSNMESITITQPKTGQWYLWYWADDKALEEDDKSNVSAMKVSGLYQVDIATPTISATPISSPWINTPISVNLKAEDSGGSGLRNIYYKWDTQMTIAPNSGYTSVSCQEGNADNITITQSKQGKWYLWYYVEDNAILPDGKGNTSEKKVSGLYPIDTTVPSLILTADTAWKNASGTCKISLIATDTGGSGVNYVKYGANSNVEDSGIKLTLTSSEDKKLGSVNVNKNGTYYFTVVDIAGNKKVYSCIVSVFDDGIPTVAITPMEREWTRDGGKNAISVAIKVSDGLSGLKNIEIQERSKASLSASWGSWSTLKTINNAKLGEEDYVYNDTILIDTPNGADGQTIIKQLQILAVDDADNSTGWIQSNEAIGYQIDKVIPTGNYNLDSLVWSNLSTYTISFTPKDIHSGVKQWFYHIRNSSDNGKTWSEWIPQSTPVIQGGSTGTIKMNPPIGVGCIYQAVSTVTDKAGNENKVFSGNYRFDRIPPTGVYTPNSCSWRKTSLTVSFLPSDDGYSKVKQWRYRNSTDNGKTYGPWSSYIMSESPTNITLSKEGYHVIQAEVIDNANNSTIVQSGQYLIDKTAPDAEFTTSRSDSSMMIDVFEIKEELSGVSRIYAEIGDTEKPDKAAQHPLLREGDRYQANITMTEEQKSIPSLSISIYLVDVAGNIRELSDQSIQDFSVNAMIYGLVEPYSPIFYPGQQGLLGITLLGYIDKVSISFDSTFLNNSITQDKEYTLVPKESDSINHFFQIPFNCIEGRYQVEVTAHRNFETKTIYAELEVLALKTNRIRIRIRSH